MTNKAILGTKLGMTQVFDDDGRVLPVTVVKAGPCPVVQVRSAERDGHMSVQIGFGTTKKVNKPLAGHFARAGVEPTKRLMEVQLDGEHEPGDVITVDLFTVGEYVDVTGKSKGKGFGGVMKRHGFAGLGAGHGVHKVHRSPGAIGACATPARVFPGTRMAGRYGNERVTTQSLQLVGVDAERNLLLIKGAVPGSNGSMVLVRNATKRPAAKGADS
ncbi:LSU ribosomal protein L3p (L3e) [Euzebya pacifica]|jgi:large subunit ribosomal protein L3|uniref:Large ribosomal subunit protein uL3 n=1 Tax=Euzebya pacifica TaxID=1608957 RepID=A0A346Y3V3_9ACTN|nr:50S ribosomal protein L3 [Euzebya pacifica]AXV09150.1 LSU ribosomal protein L3p (L3e) [Euzebya pacifica]